VALGSVMSAGAVGGVVGGLGMTAWGGPKRRIHGVLLGWAMAGIVGPTILGLGRTLPVWIAGAFAGSAVGPLIDGSNQAIWQAKVAPTVQGKVFSIRRLIAWFVTPISALLAGSLTGPFAWLVGTGPGAGMALLFVAAGAMAAVAGLVGYLVPAVRAVEDLLPDHDTVGPPTSDGCKPGPTLAQWSRRQKLVAACAGLLLISAIIGLGWLQLVVMAGP
jgi:DHA3 family macrolide efflux protein-like MFS transporter